MHRLAQHARRRGAGAETLPTTRNSAGFLDELALCGRERWLVRFELARGQLPYIAARCVSMLTQQANAVLVVERDDGGATRMVDNLELRAMAIRQGDVVDGHRDHTAAKLRGAVV